jgi:protein AroM
MANKRLGVVVIGQSPRPDVVAQMRPFVGADVDINLRGALDGLTRAEVAELRPTAGSDTLFTRLPPNGENIKLGKHAIEARAKQVIERLVGEGTTVTMLCCTGNFPTLTRTGVVVLPSAVLSGLVHGLLSRGRLGVFVPLPEQAEELSRKWRRHGLEVLTEPLLPGAPAAAIDAAARRLNARQPDLVVMDCMSYDQAMKDRVRRTVRAPVILAVAAAARVAGELLA